MAFACQTQTLYKKIVSKQTFKNPGPVVDTRQSGDSIFVVNKMPHKSCSVYPLNVGETEIF